MGYASTGAAYSSRFGDSLAFVLGEDAAVSVEAEEVGESVVVFRGEHHVLGGIEKMVCGISDDLHPILSSARNLRADGKLARNRNMIINLTTLL